ncbi:MAG TPA: TetR/AcrR family transcriptional regulator [Spirochaetota bacterium]|mgnify:FL=1|nr:TetR/AcrR family transcriptional regulator [Spirochaetota bacterium]HOM11618.1 TetR/AcrR family transcriptional regulator [Spirochaetota bacterium]
MPRLKPEARAEKEEQRKTQIITAAYEAISAKGYNNFTLDDIAKNAGLSKGGVLHYFKSKEDILIYLLEQIYIIIKKNINKRAAKYRTPERRMRAIVIAFIVTAKRHPAFYTVLVDFWAQIPINERVKHINTDIYKQLCDEIVKVIEDGIHQGVFKPVDARLAAHAIVAMVMNVAIQWTFNHELYNIDHLAKTCMKMIMSYLEAKPKLAGQ